MAHPDPAAAAPSPTTPPPGVDPERWWLENVYKHGARQLTPRAVITGMILGAALCASNLYIVLKFGWSFGVTITASILAFIIWRGLRAVRLSRTEFSPLENNAMASVASAAGYMTGGGNMAALPALLMLTDVRPGSGWLVAWFAAVSALGVFVAIPVKRQLVNVEALPFPTGTATAETIETLHAAGHGGGQKARLLGWSGLVGVVVTWLRDARGVLAPLNTPSSWGFPFSVGGAPAAKLSLSLDLGVLLIGAGALISFKTGWSMLLGAVVTYLVLAPEMIAQGAIATATFKAVNQWAVWSGAAMLVTSGLLAFAFEWRSVANSLSAMKGLFRKQTAEEKADPLNQVEAPAWWFPAGFVVLGPVVVFLLWHLFQVPVWAGVIALPLAIIMGIIAARVTGETDTTPTKALGPVTQLVYGGLLPGNMPANIMSANATGGVGLHAADLLTDLKSGFLLGANPRKQTIGQFFGVVVGAAFIVPAFNFIIPDPSMLGSVEYPAPAAMVWAGVSQVLAKGIDTLHPTARYAALVGGLVGVALVVADRYAPKAVKAFIPSPSGVGLAFVLPASSSFGFFLGSLIAEVFRRVNPRKAAIWIFPVASGLIAGESIIGFVLIVLKTLKLMPQ